MTELTPAECVGKVENPGRAINVGGVVVENAVGLEYVYVRRDARDGSVVEILLARHDGLATEELEGERLRLERRSVEVAIAETSERMRWTEWARLEETLNEEEGRGNAVDS